MDFSYLYYSGLLFFWFVVSVDACQFWFFFSKKKMFNHEYAIILG